MTGLTKREKYFAKRFYDLDANEELVNGQADLCKKCKQNVSMFGMPKNCQTCDIQAAFTDSNCERCDLSYEQFGPPKNCERCMKKCAFGKSLECLLCRMYSRPSSSIKPPPITAAQNAAIIKAGVLKHIMFQFEV